MHPVWGVPIFLGLMYLVFTLTFTLGNPLDGRHRHRLRLAWRRASTACGPPGSDSPLRSLLVDGIIGGVGGVLVFLPNIVLLFLAIAILEGTGYMARAAFVMDRFMSKVGLHGKSFIPLLIGFGCTVPAIMATRTLETRRDRLITMMVLPLMSCGARLPIYALMIPAFFAARWQGPVLWMLYVTGIVLALLGGAPAARHALPGRDHALPHGTAALPPAHRPQPAGADVDPRLAVRAEGRHGDPGGGDHPVVPDVLSQAAGRLHPAPGLRPHRTRACEQVLRYGRDHRPQPAAGRRTVLLGRRPRRAACWSRCWRPWASTGASARPWSGPSRPRRSSWPRWASCSPWARPTRPPRTCAPSCANRYTPLVGFCIMLFALISTPCIATFAITRQESGSVWWALAQTWGLTLLAWIMTFGVYRAGMLLGFGGVV